MKKKPSILKYLFLTSILSFIPFIYPSLNAETKKANTQSTNEEYIENDAEYKILKSKQGKSIYLGEGFGEISKKSLSDAIKEAKNMAIADLASSIKTRVKKDFKQEINYDEESGSNKEKLESIINTYTNLLIEDIQYKTFINYPKKGILTVLVYIDKNTYDQKVAKDIQDKTEATKQFAVAAIKARYEGNIVEAIEHLVNGKISKQKYFGDIPIKADLTGKGNIEDLDSFFDINLTQILHSIKLQYIDENIIYDTSGKPNKKPLVIATYEEKDEKKPLFGIPLKASFVKGNGVISNIPLKTGRRGEAYIPLEKVNPSEKDAIIQVIFDAESFQIEDSQNIPSVFIPLSKSKALAFGVSYFLDGKYQRKIDLEDAVKIALASSGFEIKKFESRGKELDDEKIKELSELNTEYIIYITANANTRKNQYDMYDASVFIKGYIYSQDTKKLFDSIDETQSRAQGISQISSADKALAIAKKRFIELLKEKIKNLK